MGDRVAITGAAGGIGKATAKILRSAGYDLLLIDRPGRPVGELATALDCASAEIAGTDLAAARGALDAVEGPIYGLVHLAGLFEPDPALAEAPDVWERAMAHNLENAYAFATAMEARDRKSTRLNSSHTHLSRMPSSA